MKRRTSRMYWRNGRAYGDFRNFSDVGGGRETLRLPEATRGTDDPDIAAKLFSERLAALDAKRRGRALHGDEDQPLPLAAEADDHLRQKAMAGNATERWLTQMQRHLEIAVGYFGAGRDLRTITPPDVRSYVHYLAALPNGRGSTLSRQAQRHYLNSLGNVFKRAVADGKLGLNAVHSLMDEDKPRASSTSETTYLEPHHAALLIESARTFHVDPSAGGLPFMYPLVATFLLTGGRQAEVLGLEVDDISFKLDLVRFRPNDWRRLKNTGSERGVPLWPQLREIMREYMLHSEQTGGLGRLLFPSPRPGPEAMVNDFRKSLDAVAERAGWKAGEVRTRVFRHTYATQRIQTLDHGAPVSVWTVSRELGHRSTAMVERRYGHLGRTRDRKEVLEYRIEDHRARITERLEALRAR